MATYQYRIGVTAPNKRAGETFEVTAPNKGAALAEFHEHTRGAYAPDGPKADWALTLERLTPTKEDD